MLGYAEKNQKLNGTHSAKYALLGVFPIPDKLAIRIFFIEIFEK